MVYLGRVEAALLIEVWEVVPWAIGLVRVDILAGIGNEPAIVQPGVVELDEDTLDTAEISIRRDRGPGREVVVGREVIHTRPGPSVVFRQEVEDGIRSRPGGGIHLPYPFFQVLILEILGSPLEHGLEGARDRDLGAGRDYMIQGLGRRQAAGLGERDLEGAGDATVAVAVLDHGREMDLFPLRECALQGQFHL